MGGGKSTVSGMYGIYRKTEISEKIIERSMKKLGVPLDVRRIHVRVVNQKQWEEYGGSADAIAFYDKTVNGGTLFILRKYFAGKPSKTFIHEILHGQSGTHRYYGVGSTLEEGTVEYLAQATRTFGVRGQSVIYQSGTGQSYKNEVNLVSKLMQIVGRPQYIRLWKKGFGVRAGSDPDTAGFIQLARDLRRKGFTRTAQIIQEDYYGARIGSMEYTKARREATHKLTVSIREDAKANNKPLTLGIDDSDTVKQFKRYYAYNEDYLKPRDLR